MTTDAALHAQAEALRRQADALDALAEHQDQGAEPGGGETRQRLPETLPAGATEEEESWRSRIHRVHEDTRLWLSEVAEALGVSERTVRRYTGGEGDYDALPHRRGPTGITVRAGDLRTWLRDVEEGNRFREAAS